MTNDGSTGLYNNKVKDIYHSKYGALNESLEKFIYGSLFNRYCKQNNSVKILDICYGIGYNSKSALYIAKLINKFLKIEIDAIDTDEELLYLSPLIKDSIPSLDLKLFLIKELIKQDNSYYEKLKKNMTIYEKANSQFFNKVITSFIKKTNFSPCNSYVKLQNADFLHNIYYQYISNSMKTGLNKTYYKDSSFRVHIGDARVKIKQLNEHYDFIFLDAFTPQKDPVLWTINFIELLKNKMHNDSLLVTYSNSTPYRAALLELGFYTGKIIINGKQFGTTASFNKNKITEPLDKYDIDLTKTKTGILFRDDKLTLPPKKILENQQIEKSISTRISAAQYKKQKN